MGVVTTNRALKLEGYFISGIVDKKKVHSPFYSSELYLSPVDVEETFRTFSGVGLGLSKQIIRGELAHIANQQGMVLIRAKNQDDILLARIKNDFNAAFMFGGGTDQGETGTFYLGYIFNDRQNYLHEIGLNLILVTPQPDYSRNPTNSQNSSDGSHPVLYGVEPHGNLFHGNFYGSYKFVSPHFKETLHLGIDSQKLARKLQNALHDSFGLFPRFAWDKDAKNKIYFQSKSSLTHVF